jgi:spore maturation protein CgeB
LYSRSKIVIGFSRSSSNSKLKSIKGRDFEATMCGTFYLCESNPELCEWFESDKEIVFWEDIPDLIKKVEFYLNNNETRELITKACYTRSHNEHTCMKRMEQLFKYMKETFNE